jgi:hypothetical protein
MGTTLTGTKPKDTYDSLIKVTDNGPLSGTLKALSDGLGNDSTLSLSTTAASIAGTLAVTGNATFDTNTLFVDAAANEVGVGTITPSQKLSVDGNIILQSSTAATKSVRFNSPSSNWGPQDSRIEFVPADGVNAAVEIALNLWDGNGNTNETLRFPASGGIKFPATQISSANANTLDDYEEGTWTMGIAFGGASVGVTTSQNTGTYTKIGRQVTVNGYLVLTGKGSSTGVATITGLPFTIGNIQRFYSAPSLYFSAITFTNQFQGYGNVNTTNIALEETTILGVSSAITDADFASNSNLIVSLTYFV